LIDVLVLVTLVGIVAGSMTVMFARMSSQSAEIMRTRQAISVAQALLNEIRMMPLAACDRTLAGCAGAEVRGPEAASAEVRYHTLLNNDGTRFDSVNDYDGLVQPGAGCLNYLCDIQGNVLNPAGSVLAGCRSTTSVAPQAIATGAIPAAQAWLITVTVTCPTLTSPVVLQALRTNHAPGVY
jgi:hypothetical protein